MFGNCGLTRYILSRLARLVADADPEDNGQPSPGVRRRRGQHCQVSGDKEEET